MLIPETLLPYMPMFVDYVIIVAPPNSKCLALKRPTWTKIDSPIDGNTFSTNAPPQSLKLSPRFRVVRRKTDNVQKNQGGSKLVYLYPAIFLARVVFALFISRRPCQLTTSKLQLNLNPISPMRLNRSILQKNHSSSRNRPVSDLDPTTNHKLHLDIWMKLKGQISNHCLKR